jgi:hypothetical protein
VTKSVEGYISEGERPRPDKKWFFLSVREHVFIHFSEQWRFKKKINPILNLGCIY